MKGPAGTAGNGAAQATQSIDLRAYYKARTAPCMRLSPSSLHAFLPRGISDRTRQAPPQPSLAPSLG